MFTDETGSEKIQEPRLRLHLETAFRTAPVEGDRLGVKGVIRKNEKGALGFGETAFDQGEIALLVAAVELIADNRMAVVGKMDADLMLPTVHRMDGKEGEFASVAGENLEPLELRAGRSAIGSDGVLDRDGAGLIATQGRINDARRFGHMTVNNGEIALGHVARLPDSAEFTSRDGVLGDKDEAGGFAVKTVDELWLDVRAKVEADAADEAGIFVALGGMADEIRRFVDDQEFGVLVDDVEKFFHGPGPEAAPDLSRRSRGVSFATVKEKSNVWLPVLLMLVFAATRWPGLMPMNFSAAYALVFCTAVYLPRKLAWWLPLGTMLATDLLLNLHYRRLYEADPAAYAAPMEFFNPYLIANYLSYALMIWLGTRFNPRAHWLKVVGGGVVGAFLFYLISNTASWLQLPGYAKTLSGWLQALTVGLPGFPPTWTFLFKTLLSGGLFAGLFVGAMKLTATAESAREKEAGAAREEEAESGATPETEEAKA